jgi:hypothetical protein
MKDEMLADYDTGIKNVFEEIERISQPSSPIRSSPPSHRASFVESSRITPRNSPGLVGIIPSSSLAATLGGTNEEAMLQN